MSEESASVQRKGLAVRKPGERLLKTTLKKHKSGFLEVKKYKEVRCG